MPPGPSRRASKAGWRVTYVELKRTLLLLVALLVHQSVTTREYSHAHTRPATQETVFHQVILLQLPSTSLPLAVHGPPYKQAPPAQSARRQPGIGSFHATTGKVQAPLIERGPCTVGVAPRSPADGDVMVFVQSGPGAPTGAG
ncbi:TPA: hypothetical protein ACH3X3_000039 [Trebouxia sp. C0006]